MGAEHDGRSRELHDLIRGMALFADLSGPQLEGVAHIFEERFFADGERVLRQGLSGAGLFVIVDGTAGIRIDGQERRRLARGEFFGEISVLLDEPPIADIVAVGPLRCAVLDAPRVRPFLIAHPQVCYRMLVTEAERLRDQTRWR
ncbi:MAG: cyclic nucleotide-binding domain-containing protein [Candidatus Limnocylindria bacterium]